MLSSDMINHVDRLAGNIYMTVVSTFVAYIIGLPVGLLLYVTDKD